MNYDRFRIQIDFGACVIFTIRIKRIVEFREIYLLKATWRAGNSCERMIMILILIVRFRVFKSMYTIEQFLRLRCSSSDLTIARFLFTEYNLAVTFTIKYNKNENELRIKHDQSKVLRVLHV